MLIGNVGNDPEIRYYDADQAVAQFRLATSERSYTLQNGTRVPEHTDWHAPLNVITLLLLFHVFNILLQSLVSRVEFEVFQVV